MATVRLFESASAAQRLAAATAFVRSFPPSKEILLLAASRAAADDLARVVSAGAGATFGLHRFTLPQMAAQVAAARLAETGAAPLTALGAEAVAVHVVHEAVTSDRIRYFAPVLCFPGFAGALAATLGELRVTGIDADALPSDSGATGDVGELLRVFGAALRSAGLADRSALFEAATAALRRIPAAAARTSPILLVDVELRSPVEGRFLSELLRASESALATVPAGDARTLAVLAGAAAVQRHPAPAAEPRSSLQQLRTYLFAEEDPPPGDADEGVKFFSAPGEGREAVEIARYTLDEARAGTRFDEMAVFLRNAETYTPLLQTAFRRAGLPAFFARGTKRPDSAGRAFLALLACRAEGLSARRFAEYLSFAQVPDLRGNGAAPEGREMWVAAADEVLQASAFVAQTTDEPAEDGIASGGSGNPGGEVTSEALPAPWRWEDVLVEASVVGGLDRWQRRLAGLEVEWRQRLQETRDHQPLSPGTAPLQRDLDDLQHLRQFALPLLEYLAAFPDADRWGRWLHFLSELAPRVLRRPESVLRTLAELQPMAAVGPVSIEEVLSVLSSRLAFREEDPAQQRYGRVFVASPEQARGRSFAVVFVPGLAERIFPQRPREDPLLLDEARRRLSADLQTQEERGSRERLLLRLAVGAARERIYLSYPRVDVVQARPRVTSFYGLDVARATQGGVPDFEDFERRATQTAHAHLAWPAPIEASRAIDAVEHDLAILGHLLHTPRGASSDGRARYLLELNPHLARSLRTRFARWQRRAWSEFDGLVRATESTQAALARHRLATRPYSATGLEKFSACPYRFLLSAVHGLRPRRRGTVLDRLDPLTRGKLFHEVQACSLRAFQKENLLPLGGDLRRAQAVLRATLARVADEYCDALAPPILRVWRDEVAALRTDLLVWLQHLAHDAGRWLPRHFELAFGLPDSEGRDPASVAEAIRLPGGALLRGAVDLVESRLDGEPMRVTDHKTGIDRTAPNLVVGGGETLQPVLYGLAVEAALGRPVHEARLFFCTSAGGFRERTVLLDERARRHALAVLERIDAAVEAAFLPPAPRDGACARCDFRAVCGPYEEERVKYKAAEGLAPLREIRRLP